ncbi:hypothetical protein NP233_g12866 [Leucocoprinus birnbaumii]|uniref:Myosin motor domain-containing protein n=1 Tax=Leucocoprinus birnbaumii TaxID=56174 RepID=A0AAD5YK13_9AGAR|nr:hypothetical protein NP233_g12866 [Leucocoprinus birnbaumii]
MSKWSTGERKNVPFEEPLFEFIGMLASAVGPNLTKLLQDRFDLTMSCGLNEPLKNALVIIAKHILFWTDFKCRQRRILACLNDNPILETFGNAQTQRDNNSSQYEKFARIPFPPDGSIAGANIDWYLLEKSRVVYRNEVEQNFHVCYQLLAGGGVLKTREIGGVDDPLEWNAPKLRTTRALWPLQIVVAVLHIGNIMINSTHANDATMQNTSQAERACHLLDVPLAEFTRAVLCLRALAGREWASQAHTRRQALDEPAILCKTLYETVSLKKSIPERFDASVRELEGRLEMEQKARVDDYFRTVVFHSLLVISKDQALSSHHHTVIEAVYVSFEDSKPEMYHPRVRYTYSLFSSPDTGVPPSATRHSRRHHQVTCSQLYTRHFCSDNGAMEEGCPPTFIVALIKALGRGLDAEFEPFFPTTLSLILEIKLLNVFLTFGSNIEEHHRLVIPIILKLYKRDATIQLRKKATQMINGLSRWDNLSDHAFRTIHPLI